MTLRQPVCAVLVTLAALAGARMTYLMGSIAYDRNASIVGLREWASTLPPSGLTIGSNGPEASARFSEIMQLRDPHWKNQVIYVGDDDTTTPLDFYFVIKDQGGGASQRRVAQVRDFAMIDVYSQH